MPINILMPALSPTMTEGKLAKWLKKEGDTVKSGDILAEIETDKATMEFEAVDEGEDRQDPGARRHEGVKVNAPIAVLLEEGEDASAIAASLLPRRQAPAPAAAPAAPAAPASAGCRSARGSAAGSAPVPPLTGRSHLRLAAGPAHRQGAGSILRPSPAPARTAVSSSIDVEKRQAAGPAPAPPLRSAAPAAVAAPAPAFGPAYTEIPLTSMRKVIAKRLTEAKQTVPHFYLTIDCHLDELLALRAELNATSSRRRSTTSCRSTTSSSGPAPWRLRKVPAANASFTETAIRLYTDVDVSVAVATRRPDHADHPACRPKGAGADLHRDEGPGRQGQGQQAQARGIPGRRLLDLQPRHVRHQEFAAIINPPQGCILAVGAGEQRAVVKDGKLGDRHRDELHPVGRSPRGRRRHSAPSSWPAFKKFIEEPLLVDCWL